VLRFRLGAGSRLRRIERDNVGRLDPAQDGSLGLGERGRDQRDPRVAAHVPFFGEAAHGVDPQVLTVEVAPYDRRLRVPAWRYRGERGHGRALGQVTVGRRDLSRRMIDHA
jgi:hypothetical protein